MPIEFNDTVVADVVFVDGSNTEINGVLKVHDGSQWVEVMQAPFNGTNRTLPGRIEAEHFDHGGEGVAYHDANPSNTKGAFRSDESVDIETASDVSGTYNIAEVLDGEWLEYTVDAVAGTYDIQVRVASNNSTGSLTIRLDGSVLASFDVPETGGWQEWMTITKTNVTVPDVSDGTLRLEFSSANRDNAIYNVNWIGVVAPDTTAPTRPTNLTASNVTSSSVDLSWGASTDDGSGLDHYNIYENGSVVSNVSAGTTSTSRSGLLGGASYSYEVTAVDVAGNESDTSNTVSITTPPAAPTNLRVTDTTTSSVSLAWDDPDNS